MLLCLFDASMLVFAQETERDLERSRIQSSRLQQGARYQVQEQACYARFAVFDCLHEVRLRRRATLADLHRQEQLLNDLERRHRTLEQLNRIKQKSSARPTGDDAARPQEDLQTR